MAINIPRPTSARNSRRFLSVLIVVPFTLAEFVLIVHRNDSGRRSRTFSNCRSDSSRRARGIPKFFKSRACMLGCVAYPSRPDWHRARVGKPALARDPDAANYPCRRNHRTNSRRSRHGGGNRAVAPPRRFGPIHRAGRYCCPSRQNLNLGSFRNFRIDGWGRASRSLFGPYVRHFRPNRQDLNLGSFRNSHIDGCG